ncbi:MAG TPA: alpha/beta hydrolase, partial [Patescibacteria group bacterium]|nr:alpha/beta hydrolase [Patescibacteria group bacterium]
THVGVGHTAAPYGDCMGAIVTDYLVDLTVPAEGTTCTDPPVDLGP